MSDVEEFVNDKWSYLVLMFLVILLGTKLLFHVCNPPVPPPATKVELMPCHYNTLCEGVLFGRE